MKQNVRILYAERGFSEFQYCVLSRQAHSLYLICWPPFVIIYFCVAFHLSSSHCLDIRKRDRKRHSLHLNSRSLAFSVDVSVNAKRQSSQTRSENQRSTPHDCSVQINDYMRKFETMPNSMVRNCPISIHERNTKRHFAETLRWSSRRARVLVRLLQTIAHEKRAKVLGGRICTAAKEKVEFYAACSLFIHQPLSPIVHVSFHFHSLE